MKVLCLDMEGVITPEIWQEVAAQSGVEKLSLTTRDIPDYDELMRGRLALLAAHNIRLVDVQNIIAGLSPLPGALEFLRTVRERWPLILLSDTFTQFIIPLLPLLKWPTIFCNQLIVKDGMIIDYQLRQPDGKRQAVIALQSIGYQVFAAGDSYNDLSMIQQAEWGALFRPPPAIMQEYPTFPICNSYEELLERIAELPPKGNQQSAMQN